MLPTADQLPAPTPAPTTQQAPHSTPKQDIQVPQAVLLQPVAPAQPVVPFQQAIPVQSAPQQFPTPVYGVNPLEPDPLMAETLDTYALASPPPRRRPARQPVATRQFQRTPWHVKFLSTESTRDYPKGRFQMFLLSLVCFGLLIAHHVVVLFSGYYYGWFIVVFSFGFVFGCGKSLLGPNKLLSVFLSIAGLGFGALICAFYSGVLFLY